MSPYVDTPVAAECPRDSSEDHTYDLFSVVIHGGSTHSGHYTAYIRDFDGLGTWTHPVRAGSILGVGHNSGQGLK